MIIISSLISLCSADIQDNPAQFWPTANMVTLTTATAHHSTPSQVTTHGAHGLTKHVTTAATATTALKTRHV